jgi:hypothetical protein
MVEYRHAAVKVLIRQPAKMPFQTEALGFSAIELKPPSGAEIDKRAEPLPGPPSFPPQPPPHHRTGSRLASPSIQKWLRRNSPRTADHHLNAAPSASLSRPPSPPPSPSDGLESPPHLSNSTVESFPHLRRSCLVFLRSPDYRNHPTTSSATLFGNQSDRPPSRTSS